MSDKPPVDVKRNVKLIPHVWPEDWPDYAEPGLSEIWLPDANGCILLHSCPGCGRFGSIRVGFGSKPASPSWLLQGGDVKDATTWTLSPSIHCVGCCGWHGYLTNGTFTSC